jgi:hypothetical protein
MVFSHKSQCPFLIVSQNAANVEITFATENRREKVEFATFTILAMKIVRLFLHLSSMKKLHWLLVNF